MLFLNGEDLSFDEPKMVKIKKRKEGNRKCVKDKMKTKFFLQKFTLY